MIKYSSMFSSFTWQCLLGASLDKSYLPSIQFSRSFCAGSLPISRALYHQNFGSHTTSFKIISFNKFTIHCKTCTTPYLTLLKQFCYSFVHKKPEITSWSKLFPKVSFELKYLDKKA